MADDLTQAGEPVVTYVRTRSGQSKHDGAEPEQRDALRAYAAAHGYRLVEEFVDEGCSGITLARPALDRLRDAAPTGTFKRVLVLTPDRIARDSGYQSFLMDELQQAGVAVEFVQP